jgi:hypothetical protein
VKTLPGTTAAANRFNDSYRVVWLVEVDADEPNESTTTQYYAHRKYTLHTNSYSDAMAEWPEFGWQRIRVGGGLAQVASMSLSLRNEEKAMQLVDTFFLENDEVRAYLVFADGTETITDRVEVFRGVVEDLPYGIRTWDIDVIDGSDKDFREIPQEKVNLIDFVDASFDALGKVVPEPFGNLNVGPHDDAGDTPIMAPCRNTNIFTQEYTAGRRGDSFSDVFQYYASARRYAKVVNITQTGAFFTVDDAKREMRLGPVLAAGTNDVAGYKAVMDGDSSNGVVIANTDNLDVLIAGVPKLGTIVSLDLVIDATGGYDYDVLLGGVSKASGSTTGDQTINIATATTDHTDDWDFERYEVQIDGTGAATINQIYLKLTYDDQQTQERQGLILFQKMVGWGDTAADYADGTQINAGTALTNCGHVLEAVLRGKNLMGMTEAEVNLTAFDAAVTARNGWNVGFAMDTPANIQWLNEFCFQMGLHLFKDFEGKWKVVAQEKSTAPVHTFLEDTHLAIRNPSARPEDFESDASFSRTPVRDLINEVALRYKVDRGTNEYGAVKIASGRSRLTGTCSVSASTDKLTDATATFVTDGVAVNDTVYVEGDKDYNVDAIDSETVLSLSVTLGDVNDSAAGTNYYLGPNLDGRMVRSQLRYKTENPLGQAQSSFTEVGGYLSNLIVDDTTATNMVEQLVEWRSQRRLQAEFATFLNAIDVELGDFCWFDHGWLPISKKPVLIGTITAGVNASVTTFTSAENGLLRTNDVILLDSEACLVTAVDYSSNDITVTRADDNTVAASHTNGTAIFRLNLVRWEVVGVKPESAKQQFRIQIQETPPGYLPVGIVVAAGYPAWDAATAAQRVQSGWSTLHSGRVKDEDEYSAISYVGPDTGTY